MAGLILVDGEDNVLGFRPKTQCHDGDGFLHRAFSVFVFNDDGELLIQQRSKEKRLWPLYWSNTCCSHPRNGENYLGAAGKRLYAEFGFSCDLTYLFKFQYFARYNGGAENELCAVLVGKSDAVPKPNSLEVEAFKWVNWGDLILDVNKSPERYTPWFKMEVEKLGEYL